MCTQFPNIYYSFYYKYIYGFYNVVHFIPFVMQWEVSSNVPYFCLIFSGGGEDDHTVALGVNQTAAHAPQETYVCILCQEVSGTDNQATIVYSALVQKYVVSSMELGVVCLVMWKADLASLETGGLCRPKPTLIWAWCDLVNLTHLQSSIASHIIDHKSQV